MKKIFYTCLIFVFASTQSFPRHIYGGEMIYRYISDNNSANTKNYQITLLLFRDNLGGGPELPTSVTIGIFDYGSKLPYPALSTGFVINMRAGPEDIAMHIPPCTTGNINASYSLGIYTFSAELPNNSEGYICAFESCCRVNPLANVLNSGGGANGTGVTYGCRIPGTHQLPVGHNSSPTFVTSLDLVCYNKPFTWNFSAEDPDGDSLAYSFTPGYDRTVAQSSGNVTPAPPQLNGPPDFPLLQYINGFNGSLPLGNSVSIDPRTGIIKGIAPPLGQYVTSVIVKEYRHGLKISEHRKDFILRVQDCDFAGAKLLPEYMSCDGYNYSFENLNQSPLNTSYFWDFGVSSQTNDTSNQLFPVFTFPDTGVYNIKLVVNRGQPCSDSTMAVTKIYPGFSPGFISTGICVNKPTQFTDITTTVYGQVNSWIWDFGVDGLDNDSSPMQNPSWIYSNSGTYHIAFIVSNSKGCRDTVVHDIPILEKPVLSLAFKDTLICIPDALQLQASGTGTFSWSPIQNIINANTANPTVNPAATVKYYVELDDNGCRNKDSVKVRVVDHVTLSAANDTTICKGDPATLNANSDGLHFQWAPAATIDNPSLMNPLASPLTTTIYQVRASIGSCNAIDEMIVKTIPKPFAYAGNDTIICYNTFAILNGITNGSSYYWLPAPTLSNGFILNPRATPFKNTTYFFIAFDTIGCPKPGQDTVVVYVHPKINAFAGNDTAIVKGQPLQLQASGGESFTWSPPTGLSSTNIFNPVAFLDPSIDSIRYTVYVSEYSCVDSALINVKIFKTNPQVFVPTAFTPNGDGLNDIFRPIAAGIKQIDFFQIYNRWGQLVFSTRINYHGWDGKIGGQPQASGTYVWLVKAVDFLEKPFFQKGTVTLIR